MGLTACSPGADEDEEPGDEVVEVEAEEEKVELVYVEWDSEIASTYVVAEIIENELGYEVDLMSVTLTALYESLALGDRDGMVAGWLPLQEKYYEEHSDDIVNLGPNFTGTLEGLVVPEYVPISSIDELGEHTDEFGGQIIGIEPDAGIMDVTREAMEQYEALEEYELVTGSDHTMTTTLRNAFEEEEWIIVTGWTPHWKFFSWDLKYLADPRGIYTEEGEIATIVREGLEDDMPEVYNFLDNFYWGEEEIGQVMLWIVEEDMTPENAAGRFLQENPDLVEEWLEDIDQQ